MHFTPKPLIRKRQKALFGLGFKFEISIDFGYFSVKDN
jgi:hypothetical protein